MLSARFLLRFCSTKSIINNFKIAQYNLLATDLNKTLLNTNFNFNLNLNQLCVQKSFYCSKYYSKKKTQLPSWIPVTKANAHLKIHLFDENELDLGDISMQNANNIAQERKLKLVLVDENQKPPKFQLMTGKELAERQVAIKRELKAAKETPHELKEKEIIISSKCNDNDLMHKLKSIKEFYDKGHSIKITVKSSDSNISKSLQDDFFTKIKSKLDFIPKLTIKHRDDKSFTILIPSQFH